MRILTLRILTGQYLPVTSVHEKPLSLHTNLLLTPAVLFQAAWDWLILILVIYTAIFTPYVAAFQLNEPDFDKRSRKFGEDPIVVIDMIGMI